MSYTFTQTGSEIQAILDRAEAGGQIDQDIATKAPLASPALTGDPTAPTQSEGDNSAKLATTAYADRAARDAASAAYPTDSVSGDIVSFSDGADNIPVKSFTGSIVPIQDLNGYDYPWPAGGGKNKLQITATTQTINGVTITVNADGSIKVNGTTTAQTIIPISDLLTPLATGNPVILSGCPSGGSVSTYCLDTGYNAYVDSGSGVTLGDAQLSGQRVRLRLANGQTFNNLMFYPMIRLATEADATFAPYGNICPISGWTGAEIYRTGINVWDETWELGTISSITGANVSGTSNIRSTNYIPVKPNTEYWYRNGAAKKANLRFYDINKSFIGAPSAAQSASTTFTTPDGCYFMRFYCVSDYGTTYSDNISFNFPATETAYHAHEQAQTIILTFGSTVYAGTITALGGGLWQIQPTMGVLNLATKTFVRQSGSSIASPYFDTPMAGLNVADRASAVCNMYRYSAPNIGDAEESVFGFTSAGTYLRIRDNRYSTAADFMANAIPSCVIIYPLATLPDPIIVSADDLSTLLGSNTVWTDCGSVTKLEYRADTALYIQKLLNGSGALSMASPSPSLSLGRVGVLAEPEASEPEGADEEAEQLEQTEEPEQTEEE